MGDDGEMVTSGGGTDHEFNTPTFEGVGTPGGIGLTGSDPESVIMSANNEAKSQSE